MFRLCRFTQPATTPRDDDTMKKPQKDSESIEIETAAQEAPEHRADHTQVQESVVSKNNDTISKPVDDEEPIASKVIANSTEVQSSAPAATGETADLKAFVGCFEHLAKRSPESKEARNKAWSAADPNGNGFCSLAEIDGWVKKHLLDNKMETAAAERLWKLYRPCYIRAFRDAADATEDKQVAGTESASTDDYVQRKEFRLLCAYLSIYARMFDAFDLIDGGGAGTTAADDRRMSLEEWLQGFEKVRGHGFVGLETVQGAVEAEAVFKEIDADGRGMVLLGEWCSFMKGKEQAAGTALGQLLSVGDEGEDDGSDSGGSVERASPTNSEEKATTKKAPAAKPADESPGTQATKGPVKRTGPQKGKKKRTEGGKKPTTKATKAAKSRTSTSASSTKAVGTKKTAMSRKAVQP